MTPDARLLDRPVAGSWLLSGMPSMPRPANAGHFQLPALPSTPYWARKLTLSFLGECFGITVGLRETAELLVSELVTNATLAAGELHGLNPAQPKHASATIVSLSLQRFRNGLLIEVRDSSLEPPIPTSADTQQESGRGLMLVAALSEEWGYFPAPGGGKVVYCFLRNQAE